MAERRRLNRSVLIRAGVFIALGAAVNVAVAWTCVLNPWRSKQDRLPLDLVAELAWWHNSAPADMAESVRAARLAIPGVDQDLISSGWKRGADMPANEMVDEEAIRVRAGWPARALEGAVFIYVPPPPRDVTMQVSF